jgi:hypothetical protein
VFHAESLVAFGAHGFPRPIPGLPQEKNFQGHSFAAAHVTAHAAALMKQYPDHPLETIIRQLQNNWVGFTPRMAGYRKSRTGHGR